MERSGSGTRSRVVLGDTIGVSENEVVGLAFSPDDRWLLTGDYESIVKLYAVSTGRAVSRYEGHSRGVRCVAFTRDGLRIVTAGDDKSVRLWDARTRRELLNYDGVSAVVYGIAISPDGRRLAAGLADLKILIWDLSAGTLLHTFELKTGGCLGLAFIKDGRELVAGLGDGSIWIGGLPPKLLGESDPAARPPSAHQSQTGRAVGCWGESSPSISDLVLIPAALGKPCSQQLAGPRQPPLDGADWTSKKPCDLLVAFAFHVSAQHQ